MEGIIILGHGSRAGEANQALQTISRMVERQVGHGTVKAAYLQFSEPDLEKALRSMIKSGFKKIIIMPYFLYRGIHLQEDIPQIMRKVQRDYGSQVEIVLAGPLGEDDRLVEIVVDRIREVG